MTSREIAELTGKRHDHVLRDIDNILDEISPDLGRSIKSTTYSDEQNRSYRQYELDFRATMLVITRYSDELRLRIIDRWQELEAKAAAVVIKISTTMFSLLAL